MNPQHKPSRPKLLHAKVRTVALADSVRGKELVRLAELGLVQVRHGATPRGVKTLEVL